MGLGFGAENQAGPTGGDAHRLQGRTLCAARRRHRRLEARPSSVPFARLRRGAWGDGGGLAGHGFPPTACQHCDLSPAGQGAAVGTIGPEVTGTSRSTRGSVRRLQSTLPWTRPRGPESRLQVGAEDSAVRLPRDRPRTAEPGFAIGLPKRLDRPGRLPRKVGRSGGKTGEVAARPSLRHRSCPGGTSLSALPRPPAGSARTAAPFPHSLGGQQQGLMLTGLSHSTSNDRRQWACWPDMGSPRRPGDTREHRRWRRDRPGVSGQRSLPTLPPGSPPAFVSVHAAPGSAAERGVSRRAAS